MDGNRGLKCGNLGNFGTKGGLLTSHSFFMFQFVSVVMVGHSLRRLRVGNCGVLRRLGWLESGNGILVNNSSAYTTL